MLVVPPDAVSPSLAPFWHLITRLGEAQILLPLVGAAAAWLWLAAEQGRLALRWGLAIGLAALLTTLSKLAFMGWGLGSARWDFTGISGHAMFAGACLPVLAWVGLLARGDRARRVAVVGGFLLAALVAWSRLEVRAHSPSEALAGALLGGLASAWVLWGAPTLRLALPLWLPAGLAAAVLLLPLSAPRSRSHELMMELSRQLSGRQQVYTRHELHRRLNAAALPVPGTTGPARSHPRSAR
ncbi:phosphatase PAP2 family protein [Roseateles sp. DAIF2]|uniref:phosphatase PAP2 family protein n=1 Tax=Roseateles sp. DAIF2 TaxID=2714952 RepID=UPI0018A2F8E2|nr:phosphatase PAP2 family protein [Roseateles sp. DAIF2]QPF71595.1 phosphatase PAP2 family protein [Roseateles sp. DAIF2]